MHNLIETLSTSTKMYCIAL